ncbi:geraniol 8-hydroxylase-like [Andrographis paniculata]|uniref:geraniol 8-hydroxylase-like n=1 Tax=Andrographis paniculata TaxID=175694 RepID=UPI0021E83CAF|nr:geraniol 8-hydroxylase-like [Andrographis paniculata]
MDYDIAVFITAFLLWAFCAAATEARRRQRRSQKPRLPPGPQPWPVVGNIFHLMNTSQPPHQSLAKLADTYGPVMTLRLGSLTTAVISSGAAADAVFRQNDVALAGRMIYESMKGDVAGDGSLISAQYGPRWRMLRRLCTSEFFSAAAIDATRGARAACVEKMTRRIHDGASQPLELGELFFSMAFDLIGILFFSRDMLDPNSGAGAEFFSVTKKFMEFAGRPNVADFFPILRRLDPQGVRKTTQLYVKRGFDIVGKFLERRSAAARESNVRNYRRRKDYVDVLLKYKEDGLLSATAVNVIVFEMFAAGTDTTTSTLEWAMAELLRNREILRRVQAELRSETDPQKSLEEDDLDRLPYLRAVIKETLRLHPPLPFLVPRRAAAPCRLRGFDIPEGTQVLVNAWAIGRDAGAWEEPMKFRPERFLTAGAADYRGRSFELIPFGAGRRICPAMPLALRVVPMALGAVLRSFDWLAPPPAEIDMEESMGITLRKAVPLKAIPLLYN